MADTIRHLDVPNAVRLVDDTIDAAPLVIDRRNCRSGDVHVSPPLHATRVRGTQAEFDGKRSDERRDVRVLHGVGRALLAVGGIRRLCLGVERLRRGRAGGRPRFEGRHREEEKEEDAGAGAGRSGG